jgi:hypothetical protein
MADLPDIQGINRKKPLCFDPSNDRFITFDDIVEGAEKIVPLDELTDEQLKRLVIERYRMEQSTTVQPLSGPGRKSGDVINEIESETEFGKMVVMAETRYLRELLKQISDALSS